MRSRLQTQVQLAPSTNLILKDLKDIPHAEKSALTGLSASIILGCVAAPAGGALAALAIIAGGSALSLGYYLFVSKPKQDSLANEYYRYLGSSGGNILPWYSNKRMLEIFNEVSTGNPEAYPEIGPDHGHALHNACVSRFTA